MKKLLSFLKRPWMVLLLTLLSFEIVVFFTWQRLDHTPGLRLHVMLHRGGRARADLCRRPAPLPRGSAQHR